MFSHGTGGDGGKGHPSDAAASLESAHEVLALTQFAGELVTVVRAVLLDLDASRETRASAESEQRMADVFLKMRTRFGLYITGESEVAFAPHMRRQLQAPSSAEALEEEEAVQELALRLARIAVHARCRTHISRWPFSPVGQRLLEQLLVATVEKFARQ